MREDIRDFDFSQEVTPLTVVPSNSALRLKAIRDVEDSDVKRVAGDEWLFEGPGIIIFVCILMYEILM